MIDIHSHILPEVDDGAKSWETALEMCRMATADGIEHMVATPHANERYHYDRAYLTGLLNDLQTRNQGAPRLSLGSDFHLSYENLVDLVERPEKYVIGSTHYLLVELSNFSIPVQLEEWFTKIGEMGLTPVITHPERNPILQQSLQRVLQWVELGCVVQVTASAVTTFWGERPWRAAQWLLKHRAVHVLATDAHDTKRRVPVLSEARNLVAEDYGQEVARALVDANPRAIVNGEPLPYFPDPGSGK